MMSSQIRALSGSFARTAAVTLLLSFSLLAAIPCAIAQTSGEADKQDAYARSEALVRQGHWDEGIAMLTPLLASNPNLKALNLMGLALTGKGDLNRANAQFERVLQIDPKFVPALKNLAVNEFNLKEFVASERHLSAALKLAPTDPVIHAYLGEIAFRRNEYPRAAEHLSLAGRLLFLDPDFAADLAVSDLESGEPQKALALVKVLDAGRLSARSQFELGYALAHHNLFTEAASYFEAVVRSYPNSYDARYNLAICYLQAKEYPSAITAIETLVSQGHETAEVENLLARAYESNHQTKEAVAALREAIRLAPTEEDNYVDLVTLCVDHNAYDLGMDVLNVGLHYHPKSANLIFQRGVLHALHDESSLAEKDFELASQLAPDKNFSYIGMGLNSIQTGNLSAAIQLLRRRIRKKPDDFMLQYLLGRALIESGAVEGERRFQQAQTALEASVHLNPHFSASRVELAKIYLGENHLNAAVVNLEDAVKLDPKDNAAYSHLIVAYRKQGKPMLAKKAIDSLKQLNEEERSMSPNGIRLVKANTSGTLPATSQ